MIRKIIVPTESQYILNIPNSFLGKKIEVLAFELEEPVNESDENNIIIKRFE